MSIRPYFFVAFLLAAMAGAAVGSKASGKEISLAEVEGCSRISAPISGSALRKLVEGHIHSSSTAQGELATQTFSLLVPQSGQGVATTKNPKFGEYPDRYWFEKDRVCMESDWCMQIARCTKGSVPYVAWTVGSGAAWAISTVEPDPAAAVPALTANAISPKPDYDPPPIAPAADWSVAKTDFFRGFAGLNGIYIAERQADNAVIEEFFAAHDFTRGNKFNDGRREVRNLIRLHHADKEPTTAYNSGSESGTREVLFGVLGPPGDKLDLASLDPGVVDVMTDAEGAATQQHWSMIQVYFYWTAANWDPTTFQNAINIRVISPRNDLLGRAVVLCDATEFGADAPQLSVFAEDQPCRRYNRAFEVTEMLDGKNALQVAAALKRADEPLVMMAGEIGIAGDRITVSAAPVPSLVTINDGRFHGWDSWLDQTRAANGRGGRRIVCELPIEDAEDLAALERGDLLRFIPKLREVSDRIVRLECDLS
jgi:hypothetical protein